MLGGHSNSFNRGNTQGYAYASQQAPYGQAASAQRNSQYGPGGYQQGYAQGPSGYPQNATYRGPPPGADPEIWRWFDQVDQDHSGTITASELQAALVNGNGTHFDIDTIKMIMGMFDTNRDGTIGFNEFSGLWTYIAEWQRVFRQADSDRSGAIDGHELASALRGFGYNLSATILSLIEQKYSTPPSGNYGAGQGISFDRFVRACVTVRMMQQLFESADTNRDGWITVNYEQFMQMVLRVP